jgi:hypothetical protein
MTARSIDFSYAPTSGWTLICRPDDPFKSLVREDGALLYGFHASSFDAWSFDAVLEFHAQTAHEPLAAEQRTETSRRPIVTTTIVYPSLTLELTTFASVDRGRRSDVVLWKITAEADVEQVLTGLRIDAYLRGAVVAGVGDGPCFEVHAVPVEPRPPTALWMDDLPRVDAPPDTSIVSLRSLDHPLLGVHAGGFRPASALLTKPVLLHAGESVAGAFVIPQDHADAAGFDAAWATAALEAERRFWDELELTPSPLEVPDPEVQDMLLACSRNMLQAREVEDGLSVLHVGPTIYRGMWIVDGYFMLEAARYLGFEDAADAGVELLLRRARPSGAFTQMTDVQLLKETGVAIATLVRQAELTGNRDRLRRCWNTIRAGVSHIEELREQTLSLPADHPLRGLMPESFGDGGIGDFRPEYTTTLLMLFGLKFATRGARLIEEEADHARFAAAYELLRETFCRSAERQRRPLEGTAGFYLPMAPPGSGGHQFYAGLADTDVPAWRLIQPETAIWALCHAIWPGEVFQPDETIVSDLLHLLDLRDDEEGIPATTGFLSYRGVWTYAAAIAANVWLYGGRPDKAIDYLYAFANHAYPTRVWREEQPLRAGGHWQICGDMPHNWASAELIRLVRHLLVFERDDELELLAGLPEEWVYNGAALHVERTPTRFGAVSMSLRVVDDVFSMTVARHPRGHPDPRRCTLVVPPGFDRRLRVEGRDVETVTGRLELDLAAGAVLTVEGAR